MRLAVSQDWYIVLEALMYGLRLYGYSSEFRIFSASLITHSAKRNKSCKLGPVNNRTSHTHYYGLCLIRFQQT